MGSQTNLALSLPSLFVLGLGRRNETKNKKKNFQNKQTNKQTNLYLLGVIFNRNIKVKFAMVIFRFFCGCFSSIGRLSMDCMGWAIGSHRHVGKKKKRKREKKRKKQQKERKKKREK